MIRRRNFQFKERKIIEASKKKTITVQNKIDRNIVNVKS